MNARVLTLLLASLALHGVPFPAASMAQEVTQTIRLDGKTLYIPEVKLTRKVNPVPAVLFIGAWISTGVEKMKQNPLGTLDPRNDSVIIQSPEKLLENAEIRVATRDNINAFLDSIAWGKLQATHFAFKVVSPRRQPAVIEIYTDADAILFNNGKPVSRVYAAKVMDSGGRGYLPVMLEAGRNIINIKQYSIGEPNIKASVCLDHSSDLKAAWQTHGGLLKELVTITKERANLPELDWNPYLGNITISMEVRNVCTGSIVYQSDAVRRSKLFSDDSQAPAPGVYQAVYRTQNDSASELFTVGDPNDLFAQLKETLSKYTSDSESKLDIEAQLRRARILLAKNNYNIHEKEWQEKFTYTLNALAIIERRLKEGVTNIAKDQPGLHIRGFASMADGFSQYYKLFIPSSYNPGTPLPLLVIQPTRIGKKWRPFIEGPVMANHRQALLWAKYAERYGFALLWPGYRSTPEGYAYESLNTNEAIQAIEKDYNIDKHRISVFATCSAGYSAGRLIEEYDQRFAAIVYDRAVFDLTTETIKSSPSLMEWYATINPSRHVIANRNIRIFVMHDDTKPAGHGQMELTTKFLEQAGRSRDDVVSYLAKQPMSQASRMDMVFDWVAQCRNENPDGARSHFSSKAGYIGPIMEIFTTPMIIAVASHAEDNRGQKNVQRVVVSLADDYKRHFHGADCIIKIDDDVTPDDIKNNSLILIGNPQSNSVWEELQPQLPVKVTPSGVLYENERLTGAQPFQAIVRHPAANDKYVLLIGAGDLGNLGQVTTDRLFTAAYDCRLFVPGKIIGKLSEY